MERQMLRQTTARLMVGITLLSLVPGCGGKTPAPPPAPTVAASAAPTAAAQTLSPLARRGRALYFEEAGPPSCQVCHGTEARGNPELQTPDIRGKTEADVRKALQNGDLMRTAYGSLTDQQIKALVAYLEFLGRQKAN